MTDIEILQEKLNKLREIPQPDLQTIIAMHNLEQMIQERQRKAKK